MSRLWHDARYSRFVEWPVDGSIPLQSHRYDSPSHRHAWIGRGVLWMGEGEIGFQGIVSGEVGFAHLIGSHGDLVDMAECFLRRMAELSLRQSRGRHRFNV